MSRYPRKGWPWDNPQTPTITTNNTKSWYCDQCHVEVYDRRCPHCGKLEKDKS